MRISDKTIPGPGYYPGTMDGRRSSQEVCNECPGSAARRWLQRRPEQDGNGRNAGAKTIPHGLAGNDGWIHT